MLHYDDDQNDEDQMEEEEERMGRREKDKNEDGDNHDSDVDVDDSKSDIHRDTFRYHTSLSPGIVIEFFFAGGSMLLALMAYYIRDWVWLQLAASVPMCFFLLYFYFIDESCRWHLLKGNLRMFEKVTFSWVLKLETSNVTFNIYERTVLLILSMVITPHIAQLFF